MKQYRSFLQMAPKLEGRTISGTALIFDSWSNILYEPLIGQF